MTPREEVATTLPCALVVRSADGAFVMAKEVEVPLVVEPKVAWKELGKMTWDGSERVTAPVPADAVIWFAVPASEVTKEVEVAIW